MLFDLQSYERYSINEMSIHTWQMATKITDFGSHFFFTAILALNNRAGFLKLIRGYVKRNIN